MDNHVHIIWRAANAQSSTTVQHAFMTYIAQTILKDLKINHLQVLPHFLVAATDRTYLGKKPIKRRAEKQCCVVPKIALHAPKPC